MSADGIRMLLVGGLLAMGLWQGMKMVSTIRGIRNNNPGNIEWGNDWQGLVPPEQRTDERFAQFIAPEYGIRAMAKIIRSYANRGAVSVRAIISNWAPPSENDTASYVAHVANNIGMSPDAPLSSMQWPGLIAAIIQHENGIQPYDSATIQRGVSLA